MVVVQIIIQRSNQTSGISLDTDLNFSIYWVRERLDKFGDVKPAI